MNSGSESTPMIESDSSRDSESQDRGVAVQQRAESSSDSSDQSMDESSSAEMELEESGEQLARVPVQAESTSEEESSSSEDSSDSSDDNSDSDDSADQDDGAQATIADAEMPDVSDTSSDESSSKEVEEEQEFEPEPSSFLKEDIAPVATSSSNQAASSPTPSHIPGLQHVVSPTPAPQAHKPQPPAITAIKNNEVDTMVSISPNSANTPTDQHLYLQ